jgi:hypothetical protein
MRLISSEKIHFKILSNLLAEWILLNKVMLVKVCDANADAHRTKVWYIISLILLLNFSYFLLPLHSQFKIFGIYNL